MRIRIDAEPKGRVSVRAERAPRPAGRQAGELEPLRAVVGSGCRLRKGQGRGTGTRVALSRTAAAGLTVNYAKSDGSAKTVELACSMSRTTRARRPLTLKLSNASSSRTTDAGGERNERAQRPAAAALSAGLDAYVEESGPEEAKEAFFQTVDPAGSSAHGPGGRAEARSGDNCQEVGPERGAAAPRLSPRGCLLYLRRPSG